MASATTPDLLTEDELNGLSELYDCGSAFADYVDYDMLIAIGLVASNGELVSLTAAGRAFVERYAPGR